MKKERREARNLLLLLSSASFLAFLIVIAAVYYFGTTGTFLLRDILVSPETISKNTFTEYNAAKERTTRFVFTKIEFEALSKEGKGWRRYPVSQKSYARFYDLIYSERSLPLVTENMMEAFKTHVPSELAIYVRGEDPPGTEPAEKIFQRVQFIEGSDIFRVQTHIFSKTRDSGPPDWLYFRYAGVYEKSEHYFTQSAP